MTECWKCKQKYKETDLMWVNVKHRLKLLCDKCKQEEIDAENVAPTTKTSSS